MASSSIYNHYPLIGRNVPRGCGLPGDTANPFAAITCPACRARLEKKVALENAAFASAATRQERSLHQSTARQFAQVLAA